MFDALIIGGGAAGCAVARYLSRYELHIGLLESKEAIYTGSGRAIVHTGLDALPGTKQARFTVRGNELMEPLSRELGFPYRRSGALVLCRDEKDMPYLRELHQRGKKNHVRGLSILWGEALRKKEPALPAGVYAALYVPTSATVYPFDMISALAKDAAANGCAFQFNRPVDFAEREGRHFLLHTAGGAVQSRMVISAAGTDSIRLHNQLCEKKMQPLPFCENRSPMEGQGGLMRHTVLTLDKKMLLSPAARDDFIVGESAEGFFEAAGLGTCGISAAPAIGEYLAEAVAQKLDASKK